MDGYRVENENLVKSSQKLKFPCAASLASSFSNTSLIYDNWAISGSRLIAKRRVKQQWRIDLQRVTRASTRLFSLQKAPFFRFRVVARVSRVAGKKIRRGITKTVEIFAVSPYLCLDGFEI